MWVALARDEAFPEKFTVDVFYSKDITAIRQCPRLPNQSSDVEVIYG